MNVQDPPVAREESGCIRKNLMLCLTHELRTPLNGILGLSGILGEQIRTGENAGFVKMIQESALRLSETLDRLILLARFESGDVQMALTCTELSRIVREVAARFAPQARAKGLRLAADVRAAPVAAMVDGGMLEQALCNVVDNAIKFTIVGCVEMELHLIESADRRVVEIAVNDTGIGIPEEFQEIVFEPFRQVSEGTSRCYEGTGLGLTLAKKIAEGMEGSVVLRSVPGQGTGVLLQFPESPLASSGIT